MSSDMEKAESGVPAVDDSGEDRERQPVEPDRLAKLPLEALLYAVMYGEEWV